MMDTCNQPLFMKVPADVNEKTVKVGCNQKLTVLPPLRFGWCRRSVRQKNYSFFAASSAACGIVIF